jgi:hypothetical protein
LHRHSGLVGVERIDWDTDLITVRRVDLDDLSRAGE